MSNRINLLLIDKHMNTIELDIPSFMLRDINYDSVQPKPHESKRDLNAEITEFLNKHNQ